MENSDIHSIWLLNMRCESTECELSVPSCIYSCFHINLILHLSCFTIYSRWLPIIFTTRTRTIANGNCSQTQKSEFFHWHGTKCYNSLFRMFHPAPQEGVDTFRSIEISFFTSISPGKVEAKKVFSPSFDDEMHLNVKQRLKTYTKTRWLSLHASRRSHYECAIFFSGPAVLIDVMWWRQMIIFSERSVKVTMTWHSFSHSLSKVRTFSMNVKVIDVMKFPYISLELFSYSHRLVSAFFFIRIRQSYKSTNGSIVV